MNIARRERVLTKPAYNDRYITPHLPTQYKCNSESQESNASRILSSFITNDGNDSNIEQINEELKGSHLFNFGCSPEKPFVPVLSYGGLLPKLERLAFSALCLPILLFMMFA